MQVSGGRVGNDPAGEEWRSRLGEDGAGYLRRYRCGMRIVAAFPIGFAALAIPGERMGVMDPLFATFLVGFTSAAVVAFRYRWSVADLVAERLGLNRRGVRRNVDLRSPIAYDASILKTRSE